MVAIPESFVPFHAVVEQPATGEAEIFSISSLDEEDLIDVEEVEAVAHEADHSLQIEQAHSLQ